MDIIYSDTEEQFSNMIDVMGLSELLKKNMSEEDYSLYNKYWVAIVVGLVTDLVIKEYPQMIKINKYQPIQTIRIFKPSSDGYNVSSVYNITIYDSSLFPNIFYSDEFLMYYHHQIADVFEIPLLMMMHLLMERDELKETIDDLFGQVNNLRYYKYIAEGDDYNERTQFVKELRTAIKLLRQKGEKLTRRKIADALELERTTFYGKLEKHRIVIDNDYKVIDKKTGIQFRI